MITRYTPKEEIIAKGKYPCNDCTHCCKFGSGYLAEGDLENIAAHIKISVQELKDIYLEQGEKFNTKAYRPKSPKPFGPCIFLGLHGCTIEPVKPLNCRTGNCGKESAELQKWFDANHFLQLNDPESIRQYALYLEFNTPLPGASLGEIIPDKAKLKAILSYHGGQDEPKKDTVPKG